MERPDTGKHIMVIHTFLDTLNECIFPHDLLNHPFYQAWSRGELTSLDLQQYAKDYYHQVESFPRCLTQLARRLENSELRQAILANLTEELGGRHGRSHADLWLDFAAGIGTAGTPFETAPPREITALVSFFRTIAASGTVEEALGAFYAYESQVPRVSEAKLKGLKQFYDANDRTCQYFVTHMTADIHHAEVWHQQLEKRLLNNPAARESALKAAEAAACALWTGLSGIEHDRRARLVETSRGVLPVRPWDS
jgi:pyrroloquinoline-quinone synthase